MKTRTLTMLSGLGLFVAAAAWTLHQQINYALASLACTNGMRMMWTVTFVAALLLVVAAAMALRVPRSGMSAESDPDNVSRPRRFLATVSLSAALLFLFAVFLQASATLFLPVCA